MEIAILSYYSGTVSRGVETFVTELSTRAKTPYRITVYHAPINQTQGSIGLFSLKILFKLSQNPPPVLMALNNNWMSFFSRIFCWFYPTKLILAGFAGIGRIDKFNLWLNPDRFICCTKAQADWARRINPWAKLTVIPIGVNTDRFQPKGVKYPLKLVHPIILCVAGPEPYKRVKLAIKAVSQLSKASLLVIGRQPKAINALGRKLLGDRYQNLLVSYDQLDQIYRAVDLFTLPSASTEAYGVTILEAMASGLPVVVNNDSIRRELVGSVGILVNPADISSYAQALSNNLHSKNSAVFRQQALKFSWPKIVKQHESLWSKLG
ncbi:MAG: glycosyltransferase family 4 protein [Patescibacteria group bacterium]